MRGWRQEKKNPQTVIFLHIVKTAGTTLHRIIERQYRPEEMYWIGTEGRDFEHLANLSLEEKLRIRVLRGHLVYGIHELLPSPSVYFTLVRDPVERVISYYYFIRRTPGHYAHNSIVSHNMTLKEAIVNQVDHLLINGQTKVLAGGQWHDHCTEESVEVAKRNIQRHFAVAGLVERFDESLLFLKKTFGWGNVLYTPQNVAKSRPRKQDLLPETLDVILEANRLDMQLYQYLAERFETQVRQAGRLFAMQVRLSRSRRKAKS